MSAASGMMGHIDSELFGRFADQLIPPMSGFPAPSEIGVHTSGLDRLARLRPALVEQLSAALASARVAGLTNILAARLTHPDVFGVVAVSAAGIYLTERRIMDAYGYPGRRPLDVGDPHARIETYVQLATPVRQRGFIWKATPGRTSHSTNGDPTPFR